MGPCGDRPLHERLREAAGIFKVFISWIQRKTSWIQPEDYTLCPIAIAFAAYDFFHSTLFVEQWDTITGDEFLWHVVQTPPPHRPDRHR